MKKLILSALAVCLLCAASPCASVRHENIYSVETERCIDVVYDAACSYLDVRYDSVATDEKKLRIIRKADLKDEAGDVIPEMCEYDEIYHLVWPAGYPEM